MFIALLYILEYNFNFEGYIHKTIAHLYCLLVKNAEMCNLLIKRYSDLILFEGP